MKIGKPGLIQALNEAFTKEPPPVIHKIELTEEHVCAVLLSLSYTAKHRPDMPDERRDELRAIFANIQDQTR